jgi:hypothetical protein
MEVEFAVAYFNNPEKVTYRYQLEGLDQDWKYLGNNNVVRFTSLPPGKYNLKVQASLNRVDWVDAENTIFLRDQITLLDDLVVYQPAGHCCRNCYLDDRTQQE